MSEIAVQVDTLSALDLDVEFGCPKCGGHSFGSSLGENQTVNCHDQYDTGCEWRGPRQEYWDAREREAVLQVVAVADKFHLSPQLIVDIIEAGKDIPIR